MMAQLERCLVCGLALEIPDYVIQNRGRIQQNLLDRELNAMFVLQKLLELPPVTLVKCFSLSGGENPASWITICGGQCQEIVNKAKCAYREMCKARQKLNYCQKEIQNKIRISSATKSNHQHKAYKTQILKTIWDSVASSASLTILPSEDSDTEIEIVEEAVDCKVEVSSPQKDQTLPSSPAVAVPKQDVEISISAENKEQENGSDFEAGPVMFAPVDVKPKVTPTVFQCDRCQKAFNKKDRLTQHKWKVHQRKKLTCSQCDYSTNFGTNQLKRHVQNKHAKNFDFPCDLCEKKFNVSGDLRRHQVANHNKCSVNKCGRICESQQKLRDHQINCHGREMDVFKCPNCELLYRQRHYLKDHIMAKHRKGNEDIYACNQCDKAFLTDHRLRNHIRKVHKKGRSKIGQIKEEVVDSNNLILGI